MTASFFFKKIDPTPPPLSEGFAFFSGAAGEVRFQELFAGHNL
jgi:hypothetical protein